jgi:hypothetical protein
LTRRQRQELRDRFESLDPFKLKQEVEGRLKPILAAAEMDLRPSVGSAPQ